MCSSGRKTKSEEKSVLLIVQTPIIGEKDALPPMKGTALRYRFFLDIYFLLSFSFKRHGQDALKDDMKINVLPTHSNGVQHAGLSRINRLLFGGGTPSRRYFKGIVHS